MELTMQEIYRYVTVGPKEHDPVAAWLEAKPDKAGPVVADALRQLSAPASEKTTLSETALLAALKSRAPLAPEHAVAWRELLATDKGRRFAAGVIAYDELAGEITKAQAVRIAARAQALLASRRIADTVRNSYRVTLGALDSVGRWLLTLVRVPQSQRAYAAGVRAPAPKPGESVHEVQFNFDDGVMFTVSLSRPRNGRGLAVCLRHAVHHEDRPVYRAFVNNRPMRLRSGLAEATLAAPPGRMAFSATAADGKRFDFGLDIARSRPQQRPRSAGRRRR